MNRIIFIRATCFLFSYRSSVNTRTYKNNLCCVDIAPAKKRPKNPLWIVVCTKSIYVRINQIRARIRLRWSSRIHLVPGQRRTSLGMMFDACVTRVRWFAFCFEILTHHIAFRKRTFIGEKGNQKKLDTANHLREEETG